MRRAAFAVMLVILGGCSLFTSLDEYDGDAVDGGAAEASVDGPATTNDAAGEVDAGGDSSDGGPGRSATYRAAVMADTPIAYFRFEEASGTTTKDEVDKHIATLVFAPSLGAPGLFGPKGGIEFPVGSKAHLTVSGDDLRFAGVAPFTIEAWLFPAVFRDFQWIMSNESTSSSRQGWSIFADEVATPSYETWPGNARSAHLVDSGLVLSKWQHLVFTYNGAVLVSYVNGAKIKSVSSTAPLPNVGTLAIGCRYSDGNVYQCLDGWRVDEIAFYGAPLTEQRVKEHYDLGVPPPM